MIIRNRSKKSILCKNAICCRSVFAKALGLMFRTTPKPMLFVFSSQRIISIHMLFVFFPIEVLWLDKNKIVVELAKSVKPFTMYIPINKAHFASQQAEIRPRISQVLTAAQQQ